MAYERILVAVDLTDEAQQVLQVARDLATAKGAKLTSITVVKPLTHVYGGLDMAPLATSTQSFEAEAIQQAKAQLAEFATQFGIDADNVLVRVGAPAYEIRAAAEELDVDLIVIGTHGKHGLGLLLGSTANAVLHGVPCDTLAVRVTGDD
jgi:universal stress protein A